MSNKTRRYSEGLGGKKPGMIYLDKEGQRAQEAGYRDHLRNEDLADKMRAARNRNSSSSSSTDYYDTDSSSSSGPAVVPGIIFGIIGLLCSLETLVLCLLGSFNGATIMDMIGICLLGIIAFLMLFFARLCFLR
jgi:hypothetical protein